MVTDEEGAPLPYASIYVSATSTGTTSNADGYYSFDLPAGQFDIVFQYVGFATQVISINHDGARTTKNVILKPEAQLLREVVISADGEDPAYSIIRKAIARRNYYRNLIEAYSCKVYVKGNTKILDAPKKILGFDIGDFDGMLDSNRQGIVYLSESVSELHYQAPDRYKEVITSSKISGDDQGYSFNSAREMDFNFYNNTLNFNRDLVSPIATRALNYYKYELQRSFTDNSGRLIHKIKVIPKRETDPVFYGTIYIVDELWNIHSLELGATAKSTQLYFVDSLTFRQIYIPVKEPDYWLLFNNSISFRLSGFGFVFGGLFTGVYNDYELNPSFSSKFFNREVHLVEPTSNERDSSYWNQIRPVPLTLDESRDYIRKDSIYAVRNDPRYKDSVDRRSNRISWDILLGGYDFTRRTKRIYWGVGSPISSFGFNTVQGFNGTIDVDFRKYFDERETKRILANGRISYGFSENKWRANLQLTYRPDRIKEQAYYISGGSDILQFNRDAPISQSFNTWYSLLARRNYAKYHDLKYVKAGILKEIRPGLNLRTSLSWEERAPLSNYSSYSFVRPEGREYSLNIPEHEDRVGEINTHQVMIFQVSATMRFNEKYVVYPDQRFTTGSRGPMVTLDYKHALDIDHTDMTYQKLSLTARDNIPTGTTGDFTFYVQGGLFLNVGNISFVDYQHFIGTQTFLTPEDRYSRRFFLLPYYNFSTRDQYLQAHIEHRFDGFIMDKIPLLGDLGLGIVIGAKQLFSKPHPAYTEFHLGLDKIGFRFFRLFRMDTILSVSDGHTDIGFRLGLKIN